MRFRKYALAFILLTLIGGPLGWLGLVTLLRTIPGVPWWAVGLSFLTYHTLVLVWISLGSRWINHNPYSYCVEHGIYYPNTLPCPGCFMSMSRRVWADDVVSATNGKVPSNAIGREDPGDDA